MLKKTMYLFLLFLFPLIASPQQEISYDGIKFTDINEAMKDPEKVEFLDLSKQKLKSIPEEVFELPNLQYLVLRKNKITEISNRIGELKKLRVFDISRNKLEVLPPEIGQCIELRTLILNQNMIHTICPEIGDLSNLQVLDLWGNEVAKFPFEISKIQESLRYLDLRVIYMSFEEQQEIIDLLPETDIYFSNGCSCQ